MSHIDPLPRRLRDWATCAIHDVNGTRVVYVLDTYESDLTHGAEAIERLTAERDEARRRQSADHRDASAAFAESIADASIYRDQLLAARDAALTRATAAESQLTEARDAIASLHREQERVMRERNEANAQLAALREAACGYLDERTVYDGTQMGGADLDAALATLRHELEKR